MRRVVFLVLAPALFSAAYAVKPAATELVTVAQLEHILAADHGDRDGALASRLAEMKLTERLSASRLAALEAAVSGRQSREALRVLGDESAFLDLPAAEILSQPVPDAETQAAILARAADYFHSTVAQRPNFTTVRTTNRFEGTATVIPGGLQDDLRMPEGVRWFASPAAEHWECPGHPKLDHRRLSVIERTTMTILHRGGHTVHAMSPAGEFGCAEGGANTADDMGEATAVLPIILPHNRCTWSHWEQGAAGPVAVFRYSLSLTHSDPEGVVDHSSDVDLRGELSVNPADGAILRLSERVRWKEGAFPKEYDTAVEFAPVIVGSGTFMCPVRRTAVFLVPALRPRSFSSEVDATYRKYHLEESPLQEYLNDVTYSEYRPYIPPAGVPAVTASIH